MGNGGPKYRENSEFLTPQTEKAIEYIIDFWASKIDNKSNNKDYSLGDSNADKLLQNIMGLINEKTNTIEENKIQDFKNLLKEKILEELNNDRAFKIITISTDYSAQGILEEVFQEIFPEKDSMLTLPFKTYLNLIIQGEDVTLKHNGKDISLD